MHEVYRLETKQGIGVCVGSSTSGEFEALQEKLHRKHDMFDRGHPSLWEDFYSDEIDELGGMDVIRCGCESVESLQNWFDKFYKKFLKTGVVDVVHYKVRRKVTGASGLQCIFSLEDIIERNVLEGVK